MLIGLYVSMHKSVDRDTIKHSSESKTGEKFNEGWVSMEF